jgi:hypothetical protein
MRDYPSNTYEPHGFFCMGFISPSCTKTIANAHDLWQRVYEAAQAMTTNMLRDVFTATVNRLEQRLEMDEGRLS